MEANINKHIQQVLTLFYPLFSKLMPYQVFSYLACGAINTVLNIALFALFFQVILPAPGLWIGSLLVPSYTVSLILAFVITVPTGFWLSRKFAFGQGQSAKKEGRKQLLRYFLVVLQGMGADYLIFIMLIRFGHLFPTVAKIISTVIVLTLNYLLQKNFTFKTRKTDST